MKTLRNVSSIGRCVCVCVCVCVRARLSDLCLCLTACACVHALSSSVRAHTQEGSALKGINNQIGNQSFTKLLDQTLKIYTLPWHIKVGN